MDNDELYQLAANAVRRVKYDDAMTYFLQILDKDPEYVEARKGLRLVQNKIGTGNKYMAKIAGLGLLLQIKKAFKTKDYKSGIAACEQYLCKDVSDVHVNQQLALLAREAGMTKTAAFAYETLALLDPSNAKYVVEAAEYISNLGEPEHYDKANQLMAKLLSHHADNTDLRSTQSKISAKKVTKRFEQAESAADLIADVETTMEQETEQQEIHTDEDLVLAIERAQTRVDDEPNNARQREVLAGLLFRRGELDQAKAQYEEALKIDGNNQLARSRMGDVQIAILNKQLELIKRKAAKLSGGAQEELLKKFEDGRKKLVGLKMQEYTRRIKINPNDLKTRYELGVIFYKSNDLDKAIQQFQKSVADSGLAFKSAQSLGYCFKAKKLYDMAIKEFMEAAGKPTASLTDRLAVQNEAGDCYLELHQVDKALEIFKKILEKDYGFKDVAKKVEQLTNK